MTNVLDSVRAKIVVVVLALMFAFTAMAAAAPSAEAHYLSYCGYSYTYHKATIGQYHYTYYGGTNSNGYEWNDYWTYQYGYGWIYDSWDWRYC